MRTGVPSQRERDLKKARAVGVGIDPELARAPGDVATRDFVERSVDGLARADAVAQAVSALGDAIPKPADSAPAPEAAAPAAGSGDHWARSDHKHPKMGVGVVGVLDANGTKAVLFGMTFASPPGLTLMSVGAGASVNFDVVSWTRENPGGSTEAAKGGYVGATIKGYKGRALPTLTALLTSVVTALSGFDPFAAPAGGVGFTGSARTQG